MEGRILKTLMVATLLALPISNRMAAQGGHTYALKFDKTVHNFGKIPVGKGAQSCYFNYVNVSDRPVLINNILSSCGCSVPEWSKAPIMPGESGKIKVTYLNDQGPYPFDKTLTVYISSTEKPILLRITGVAYEEGKSLEEVFPARFGPLGMRNEIQNGGQIEQGLKKALSENVVNLSDKAVSVGFENISPGLEISISPSTIPAGGSATISYTIDTKESTHWGRTKYSATFVCNGESVQNKFVTECMILTPYTSLSREEIENAPKIVAERSTIDFGTTSVGKKISVTFKMSNPGKSTLRIYKIDTGGIPMNIKCPAYISEGKSFTIMVEIIPTVKNPEEVYIVSLITNSPDRPLVNLFITGNVK